MTIDELPVLRHEFPQSTVVIDAVEAGTACVSRSVTDTCGRAGRFRDGADDDCRYVVRGILSAIGPVVLAVTTSLHRLPAQAARRP
jgi:hypothetical protein